MAHVTELLDQLAAGQITVDDVAADFRARTWPAQRTVTADEAQLGADPPSVDPNSWDAVDADSRLTTDQYRHLADARRRAG